jgi:sulfur carrier protein ThiS
VTRAMDVVVNGQVRSVEAAASLADLVAAVGGG